MYHEVGCYDGMVGVISIIAIYSYHIGFTVNRQGQIMEIHGDRKLFTRFSHLRLHFKGDIGISSSSTIKCASLMYTYHLANHKGEIRFGSQGCIFPTYLYDNSM